MNIKSIQQKDDVDDAVTRDSLSQQSEQFSYKQVSLKNIKDFSKFLDLKYSKNEYAININEQKELDKIIRLGLIEAKRSLFSQKSSLLHKERSPRKDVWIKLGRLANEFIQCNTYPKIPSSCLSQIINKALGKVDPRVYSDYRKTILLYCNIDENIIERCSDMRLGNLDVTDFVLQIPKQYINSLNYTSSSSSFLE